jgi:hypothetical protein
MHTRFPLGGLLARLVVTAALLAPLSALASADGPPPAAPVRAPRSNGETLSHTLDKVRLAVGRRAGQGFRATGTSRLADVEGRWSCDISADGSALQRMTGDLTYGGALTGDEVWLVDLGGEVRRTKLVDRDAQRVSIAMLDQRWLDPNGLLALTLDEEHSDASRTVIDFQVRDGRLKGEIEVDLARHLPSLWRFGEGDTVTEVTLGDWQPYEGLQIPRSVITVAGGGFRSSTVISEVGPAGPDLASQLPPSPPRDVRFDTTKSADLEVVRAPTGHLLVHPLVNGQDVGWFIFDTGAGMNVLTTSVIESLGIKPFGEVPANGVGGRTTSHFCRPDALTLGPVTLERPLMVGLDLGFLDAPMGRKIAGLIGFGFLARTVVQLDLSAPSIAVFDPDSLDAPPAAARLLQDAIAWRPLDLDQRIPHVQARFALPAPADGSEAGRTIEGYFRLDTGAAQSTVAMHEPAVREHDLLRGVDAAESAVGGVGGQVTVKKAELAWFELGGVKTEKVPADFAIEARGAFADPYSLGNIGGRLLSPFVLVFDYRHDRIGFAPRTK